MLKRNLFFLFSLTIVAIASLLLCIFNYNPYTASDYQFFFFYIAATVSLTGILGFVIYYLRIVLDKKKVIYTVFWPSIRQSFFLALAIVSVLILKGMGLFDLWVAIPLFIIIILLEMFFQTKKRAK